MRSGTPTKLAAAAIALALASCTTAYAGVTMNGERVTFNVAGRSVAHSERAYRASDDVSLKVYVDGDLTNVVEVEKFYATALLNGVVVRVRQAQTTGRLTITAADLNTSVRAHRVTVVVTSAPGGGSRTGPR